MHRVYTTSLAVLGIAVLIPLLSAQVSLDTASGPSDARAKQTFAAAQKFIAKHDSAAALEAFRKADTQDGGHCIGCERAAYKLAGLVGDYKSQREEAALLTANGAGPADKAEGHYLAGKAYLAEGGYRIYEKPFQDADSEFQAALQLQPDKAVCLYEDGVALAHLHQYAKAQERFQQYIKAAPATELEYKRAKLFAAQPELARKRVAPAFHVTAMDGRPIAMDSLAGKVVLIDFWATWCGPCRNALPHLKEIAHKFEGQPLVVISISLDADEGTWKDFVAHNGMTWLQYRDGGFDGPISTTFAVKAIPTTFTIDADGFVQDQQVGDGEIESKLQKLIEKAGGGKALATGQ
jgi:thiol-disulfide isomerase/thioredoxin